MLHHVLREQNRFRINTSQVPISILNSFALARNSIAFEVDNQSTTAKRTVPNGEAQTLHSGTNCSIHLTTRRQALPNGKRMRENFVALPLRHARHAGSDSVDVACTVARLHCSRMAEAFLPCVPLRRCKTQEACSSLTRHFGLDRWILDRGLMVVCSIPSTCQLWWLTLECTVHSPRNVKCTCY